MPELNPGIDSSEEKKSSMKCWPGWARLPSTIRW